MSMGNNDSREMKYRRDMLASIPAELQMINRMIEQRKLVEEIFREIDLGHVDIMVFDPERTDLSSHEPLFYSFVIDVKQVNMKGGQFPRGFENTKNGNMIIFETQDRNGSLGWGLVPDPRNKYVAIVDGFGWDKTINSILDEYETVKELEDNDILIRKRIIELFTRTPGQLNHRYYMLDLEGLQAFYFKHKNDANLMPYGGNSGEKSLYRRIPLSRYAEDGYGYSFWEWVDGKWICSTDGTCGEKQPSPGKLIHYPTERIIPKEEVDYWMQKVKEKFDEQQSLYALQQEAYLKKGYALQSERIDYLLLKIRAMYQHEWDQYNMGNLIDEQG